MAVVGAAGHVCVCVCVCIVSVATITMLCRRNALFGAKDVHCLLPSNKPCPGYWRNVMDKSLNTDLMTYLTQFMVIIFFFSFSFFLFTLTLAP